MQALLLLAEINRFVFAPPLLMAVSLVYAGTRHESPRAILAHALSFGGWTIAFMVVVALLIELLTLFQ